ncbi:hypothetical protein BG004_006143 [Podila humilis]|nr:hypothetical protein BG004_006143 [Podila humilis]
MLNHGNLAKHTQHHKEMTNTRNFIKEFVETLYPSAPPEIDPEPISPTTPLPRRTVSNPSTYKTGRGISGTGPSHSKSTRQQSRHNQPNPHHKKHQKERELDHNLPSSSLEGGQHRNNGSADNSRAYSNIDIKSTKCPADGSKTKANTQTRTLTTEDKGSGYGQDSVKRRNESKSRNVDNKGLKKRKKQSDNVELDVEKLYINESNDNALPSLQQQEQDPSGQAGSWTVVGHHASKTTSPVHKRGSRSRHRDGDLLDRQLSRQPHSYEKQGRGTLHGMALREDHEQEANRPHDPGTKSNFRRTNHRDKNAIKNEFTSNMGINKSSKHNKTHRQYHSENYESDDEVQDATALGKTDSNKPRKILTEDSLVMTQFKSANVTKGRITLPKSNLRKGIQEDCCPRYVPGSSLHYELLLILVLTKYQFGAIDYGRGFSEAQFLGRTTTSPTLEDPPADHQEEIVTSSYFTKPEDHALSDMSESRSDQHSFSDSTSTSQLSRNSIERRRSQGNAKPRAGHCTSTKSDGTVIRSNDIKTARLASTHANSDATASTCPSSGAPTIRVFSSRKTSPERSVDAILQELIPKNNHLNKANYGGECADDGQEVGEHFQPGQYLSSIDQIRPDNNCMMFEQPNVIPSSGYTDTGQYFDMYGYPLEPQPNARESGVQHFTAFNLSTPLGSGNVPYEWHMEPVYRWPNTDAQYIGYSIGVVQPESLPMNSSGLGGAYVPLMQQEQAQYGYEYLQQDSQGQQQYQSKHQPPAPRNNSQHQARFEWRPHRFY